MKVSDLVKYSYRSRLSSDIRGYGLGIVVVAPAGHASQVVVYWPKKRKTEALAHWQLEKITEEWHLRELR